MYVWLWRHLPNSLVLRILITAAVLALVVVACFTWVFPWLAQVLNIDDAVVGLATFSD